MLKGEFSNAIPSTEKRKKTKEYYEQTEAHKNDIHYKQYFTS